MPEKPSDGPTLMERQSIVQSERQMDAENLNLALNIAPQALEVGGRVIPLIICALLTPFAFVLFGLFWIAPLIWIPALFSRKPKAGLGKTLLYTLSPFAAYGACVFVVIFTAVFFGAATPAEFLEGFPPSFSEVHTGSAVLLAIGMLIGVQVRTGWILGLFEYLGGFFVSEAGPSEIGIMDQLFPKTAAQKAFIRGEEKADTQFSAAGKPTSLTEGGRRDFGRVDNVPISSRIVQPRGSGQFGKVDIGESSGAHEISEKFAEWPQIKDQITGLLKDIHPPLTADRAHIVAKSLVSAYGSSAKSYVELYKAALIPTEATRSTSIFLDLIGLSIDALDAAGDQSAA
ncbi:MAG: hypothetical protein AAFS13_08010 [Pseudomonadota bacterium]